MDSLKTLSVETWIKICKKFVRVAKKWIVHVYGVSKIKKILIFHIKDKTDEQKLGDYCSV